SFQAEADMRMKLQQIPTWPTILATSITLFALAGCNPGGGGGVLGGLLNAPPNVVISVTPNGKVSSADTVILDASASSDPEGDALTFEWKQTTGPDATLASATSAQAQLAPPLLDSDAELRFTVTVRDAHGGEATGEAVVPVTAAGTFGGNAQVLKTYR